MSQIAKSVVFEVLRAVGCNSTDVDQKIAIHNVDVDLAPVRECLEGLRRGPCWCGYVGHIHTQACMAAQQLMERLK